MEELVADVKSLSLRDQSLKKLIETLVSGEEVDPKVIAQADQTLADFWPKLKTNFYEKSDRIEFNEFTLGLLFHCLENDTDVDFSLFKKLTRDQLFGLINELTTGDYYLHNLNISGLLNRDDIKLLLGDGDYDIKTVYISESDMSAEEIADAHPVFEVHNANLIRRAFTDETENKPLPLLNFSPPSNPIVHAAWLTIPWSYLLNRESYHPDGSLNYKNIQHVDTSRSRYHWGGGSDNNSFKCRKYPLTDTVLPVSRFAGGLNTHLQWYVPQLRFCIVSLVAYGFP